MKKDVFYEKFIDFLEIESIDSLNDDLVLSDLDEYDSFFLLTTIAFVDENFSTKVTSQDLEKIITIGDLITFIGSDKITN